MTANPRSNPRPDNNPSPEGVRNLARMLILLAAFASFLLSVGIWFLGDDKLAAIFVGLWVPSILTLGVLLTRSER